ncbi:putative HTH transcriptional regulator [Corynebacterium felinum]|uniref:HTH transcriptional regulator n=1 Tax=Corynebacterium felinum TaxID=131318 RepID=A0ABU2B5Q6_9CORY|nr:putative HTH transcriptional regulator [Corynebacterium felinum]
MVFRGGEFNNAAAPLSDNNPFPGLRIACFGDSISEIYENFSLSGRSILEQLHLAVEKYRQYYVHEKIEKATWETVEQIPEAAFREAIANALVHRAWDVSSEIRVSMFNDRIEITSPGGLPIGIIPEEFLRVYLSVMRNPLVGFVFLRLKYIEQLGTGVGRIRDAYRGYIAEPEFEIYDSSVTVTLPVIQEATELNGRFDNEGLLVTKIVLEKDLAESHKLKDVVLQGIKDARHEKIVQVLQADVASRREIEKLTGLSSDAVQRALKELRAQGIVQQEGKGRSTRYKLHRE